jgi:hypothetical protein
MDPISSAVVLSLRQRKSRRFIVERTPPPSHFPVGTTPPPSSHGNLLYVFFLKWEQKICPNPLIKKKRIAQIINEKPDKNRYNQITKEQHLKPATSKSTTTHKPQSALCGSP